MVRSTWKIFATAYHSLIRDDGLALAGNIAFCMILALFPFLILLTALAGFFGNEALAQTVVDYLLSVAPEALANSVSPEIHYVLTSQRTGLLTLSILLTLWTASGAVESVRVGLNRAYGYEETRPYWFRFLQNVFFVIGGALVLLVLAFSIVLGPVIWSGALSFFPQLIQFEGWFHLLRGPVSFSLMGIALLAAHIFLPVKRHRLADMIPGIVLTMVVWLIAAFAYSEYLANFSTIAVMYQSLAGIIIALIFLYLSGALAIWGGEINQALIAIRAENSDM